MTEIKQKRKIMKGVCIATLIAGFVYSIVLSFCWGNNPFDPLGTLSLLCEDRKIFFWFWIIIDGGALFLNINYMYDKYGNAGKFIKSLPYIMMLSGVCIALTLGHSIQDWNPKRVAHWAATIGYIVFLAASVIIYALKNIKNGKIFVYICLSVVLILLLFLFCFIAFGKSGMLEMIPRALLEILLFVVNFIVCEKKQSVKAN